MIILQVFLALVWAVFAVGTFIGGMYLSYRHALDSDAANVPLLKALGGVLGRILGTLLAVSIIVGLPLLLLGV